MEVDASGWSGEGEFTTRLLDVFGSLGTIRVVKVEDAPASHVDAGFSFISNELFVLRLDVTRRARAEAEVPPASAVIVEDKLMTMGAPGDLTFGDPRRRCARLLGLGMLQYLRAERGAVPELAATSSCASTRLARGTSGMTEIAALDD